jgi:hypothetical protein
LCSCGSSPAFKHFDFALNHQMGSTPQMVIWYGKRWLIVNFLG